MPNDTATTGAGKHYQCASVWGEIDISSHETATPDACLLSALLLALPTSVFVCLLQVLRLTVEATGMARRLCAPREVIVERLFKR